MGRKNALIAVAVLALGLAGVAIAGVSKGSSGASRAAGSELKVSVLDSRVSFTAKTLPAGKVTLVVSNKGTKKHALAIMGGTMMAKRTPSIGVGKTVRLTVTLTAGKYHMWDPVTSSMSHAKFITVKAPSGSSSSSGGSTGGGSTGSSGSGGGGSTGTGGGSTGTGGGGGGTMDPGMDGCDGHM
jgi:iron uptake system EfeUOB component EfeO/EfeM